MSVELSNVASSASSVEVLAAKPARRGAAIYNDSTAILYVTFGDSTASTTNFTRQMASETYLEIPSTFTGAIQGIWAAANGFARVTEW